MTKHEFKKGDHVTVTDKNTASHAPYSIPCTVQDIEGDYYVMRKRTFAAETFKVGAYYPHMKIETE